MAASEPKKERPGRTSTSSFGVGKRESHDASGFYDRFEPPELSSDDRITLLGDIAQSDAACIKGDSRKMVLPDGNPLPDNSVALVVTSPPYFSGKEYELAMGQGHVPANYLEYLEMLRQVFEECRRVLEPGGRIAVNVANLGRKPYRSLASDIVGILQDDLRMLLRGEVIWRKGEGASGSCAWGSFRSAANPVLRDITERVVIASKGRFDRAKTQEQRRRLGLPHDNEISPDEFMEATLDVWTMSPESAKRVSHPAPFPVELPTRLIGLYTYQGDLVVDPFMGSGTTLVAAMRGRRRYLGYDTDPEYVKVAKRRVRDEFKRLNGKPAVRSTAKGVARRAPEDRIREALAETEDDFQARASKEGKVAQSIAEDLLLESGFRITQKNARLRGLGVSVSFVALDGEDLPWYFDVSGAFTTTRGGLLRTDNVWKSLGRANVLYANGRKPIVFLTSNLPKAKSEGDLALRAVGPDVLFDAIEMLSEQHKVRLKKYAEGGHSDHPEPGFWAEKDPTRP
ncbi:MAG: site-specific DNA-methyltransferase [Acidimicrobiales bacterium]